MNDALFAEAPRRADVELDRLLVDLLHTANATTSNPQLGALGEAIMQVWLRDLGWFDTHIDLGERGIDLIALEPEAERLVAIEVKTSRRGTRFRTRRRGDLRQCSAAWIADRLGRVGYGALDAAHIWEGVVGLQICLADGSIGEFHSADDGHSWQQVGRRQALVLDDATQPFTALPETPGSSLLGDGVHPDVRNRTFTMERRGRLIHVDTITSSSPFAGLDAESIAAMTDPFLAPARASPLFTAADVEQLRTALVKIIAVTPSATGLFPGGGYSGRGATGLLAHLGHPRNGPAYAFELLLAALLCERPVPADDSQGPSLRVRTGVDRIDFGVKLALDPPGRSTIEADLLLSTHEGRRRAIDAKYTSRGRSWPGRISAAYLDGVQTVLARGEIDSFHVVVNTWLGPRNLAAVERASADGAALWVNSLRTGSGP